MGAAVIENHMVINDHIEPTGPWLCEDCSAPMREREICEAGSGVHVRLLCPECFSRHAAKVRADLDEPIDLYASLSPVKRARVDSVRELLAEVRGAT